MQCACGGDLDYMGITLSPRSKLYHQVSKCDKCGKAFKHNPGVKNPQKLLQKPAYKKAINLYETFNMKPVDQIYLQKISLPGQNNPLVHCGKCAGILYLSDKEQVGRGNPGEPKKLQTYIHECKSPHPDFYVTSDGQTFLINGGKMKIAQSGKYKGWLVD